MDTNQKATNEGKQHILLPKEYLSKLIHIILELREDVKRLHVHIEEREGLLDALEVRQKFGIGRDLLAQYRKEGLKYDTIGRKYFYKGSDIILFTRMRSQSKS